MCVFFPGGGGGKIFFNPKTRFNKNNSHSEQGQLNIIYNN